MPSNDKMLDAPIPGQSLTGELGSKPWERAPQLNTVEEVINKYLPLFDNEDIVIDFVNQMDSGIPITTIVNLLTKSGVMSGLHSIDTGLLASPVLIEMLISVAEASNVKYKLGTEETKNTKPRMSAIRASLKDLDLGDSMPMGAEEVALEEPTEPPKEESMGMMSRREV